MIEVSLDTFITLYKNSYPDHTTAQAIECLNTMREEQKAMLPYFDHEDEPFPIWDSGIEWAERRTHGTLFSFKLGEYLIIEGSTAPHGMGWPVEVKVPKKDWYKIKVQIF